MSILIICNNKDPEPWAGAIRQKLPGTEIQIFPDVKNIDNIDFALCWKPGINVLDRFKNIRAIQSLGASVEHIFDTNSIRPEVQVARIIDPQLSQDMFEFLLTLAMNYLRGIDQYKKQQVQKQWDQLSYRNINSTCISILGAGKIGGHVAAEFAKSGFQVQTWSEEIVDIPLVNSRVGKDGLEEMLGITDVLINLLPLTNKTKGLLNNELLGNIKEGTFLINVGRGPHLIEKDLLELLESGRLSGAALDVFDEEPLPDNHVFWDHPGISITPHVASLTNINTAVDQIVVNYKRLQDGEVLLNTVSHKKGY